MRGIDNQSWRLCMIKVFKTIALLSVFTTSNNFSTLSAADFDDQEEGKNHHQAYGSKGIAKVRKDLAETKEADEAKLTTTVNEIRQYKAHKPDETINHFGSLLKQANQKLEHARKEAEHKLQEAFRHVHETHTQILHTKITEYEAQLSAAQEKSKERALEYQSALKAEEEKLVRTTDLLHHTEHELKKIREKLSEKTAQLSKAEKELQETIAINGMQEGEEGEEGEEREIEYLRGKIGKSKKDAKSTLASMFGLADA